MQQNQILGRRLVVSIISLLLLVFFPPVFGQQATPSLGKPPLADSRGYAGNEACASGHADIYKNYQQTAMARASGPALQGLVDGEFQHAPSGVHYRVYAHQGEAWLSFDRSGDPCVMGVNLARVFCSGGQFEKARTYTLRVLEFNPDLPEAKTLMRQLSAEHPKCGTP
jgi:hypothetical protein